MHLYYNAAKKYKQPIPNEAVGKLKYDVKELRGNPEKLTKSYREYEKHHSSQTHQVREWAEWKT